MRTRLIARAVALALAPTGLLAVATPATAAGDGRMLEYRSWAGRTELTAGLGSGVRVARGALRLDSPTASRVVEGRRYDVGRWLSPWVSPGFAATELVASWNAVTPDGTFVEVDARGRTADGRTSSWDSLGRWVSGDRSLSRTSLGSQDDDLARVSVDTLVAPAGLTRWRLRVTLHRMAGSTLTPRVRSLGAVASRIPSVTGVATSRPGVGRGTVLDVPRYSQMIHQGHAPQYGGGGEAWCSPTSLAMVLGWYDALPPASETAWVGTHPDRVVDHLARMTYDTAYRGTGNWPFNTAYAGTRVAEAFVTRFHSLRGVERFVAAGIPVITSVTFSSGQLAGAPISATNGHLLVVVGFTAAGDVVVNDPAAASRAGVRRTYDRGQFEDAWLKRGGSGGSGGLAYVVRDAGHPLPARAGATTW